MSLNFNEVAKTKLNEVERPPLIPAGPYRWAVIKLAETTTTADGKWDIVNFPVRGVEALDGVDEAQLEAFGGATKAISSVRFMFNKEDQAEFDRTLYNLRRFLENTLQCATPEMSIAEGLNAAVNQQFIGDVVWKADKQVEGLFHANIGKTAPLS